MPNGCRIIHDITLQPTNTYQLREKDVLPHYGQPPLTQERQERVCEYIKASRGGSVDKPPLEPASEEGIKFSGPSVLAWGQGLQHGEQSNTGNCLGQSLHTTTEQQSDTSTVRSDSRAQHQTQPMLEMATTPATVETCISDKAVDVACRGPHYVLPSQNGGGSQAIWSPARLQLHTHTPAPTQDLNAALGQLRTSLQQVFQYSQAPLNTFKDLATGLEQEPYRTQNKTMRLGRYMTINAENIIGAVESIGMDITAIEILIVEISKGTQKRAEDKARLYNRTKGLEKKLKALQNTVSPCLHMNNYYQGILDEIE